MNLLERSIGCGAITEDDARARREVVLTGWVHRRRDLGQLIFIELRDASGRVQLVFDPSTHPAVHGEAESLRYEFVVGVRGTVVPRESPNPQHPTGMVEVQVGELVIHNRAESLPFPVGDDEVNEESRLTHRYVDLRHPRLQHNLRTRHRLASAARAVLEQDGFIELETPILTRSTPEGARDYLVPSRVHPGKFFALPQSPQLFKQLLMVAGFERYFQFARCFRDEDLRADRQPEFTQIDLEMSFATPEQIYHIVEPAIRAMFVAAELPEPGEFPHISYAQALDRFGSDRPDTRFGLELKDVGPAAQDTGFQVFDKAIAAGGTVRGIVVDGAGGATRRQLDGWTELAKKNGAGGLIWFKRSEGKLASTALKAIGEERCQQIMDALGAGDRDAVLVVADDRAVCNRVLGELRLSIAAELKMIPADCWNVLWVESFPLFNWDTDGTRWAACHHPFTAPQWDQLDLLEQDPGKVLSQAYDLVLNGVEIGGGSIRIHRRDVQDRVFRAMQITPEEAREKFGFLLQALDSGAPPHGGIALGFDRICAMLVGADSIRDVIAFPKTTRAACLMTDAPANVDDSQLAELSILRADPT